MFFYYSGDFSYVKLPYCFSIENSEFNLIQGIDLFSLIRLLHYGLIGMLGTVPPSILSSEYWNNIDATTFRIRGKSYIADRVKVASAPAVFKLIAIDVSDENPWSLFASCMTILHHK
jgi:Protein ENHANCED DISEASE RESISTANCE 2, C-terminal